MNLLEINDIYYKKVMARAKKKPVAMRSKRSGKKKAIQIKKNNEVLQKLKKLI
jgi:hypothetical protein